MGNIWFPPKPKSDKGEETLKEDTNPSQEDCQINEEFEVEPTISYVEEEIKSYNQNSYLCTNHLWKCDSQQDLGSKRILTTQEFHKLCRKQCKNAKLAQRWCQ